MATCGCKIIGKTLSTEELLLTIENPNIGEFIIEVINRADKLIEAVEKMLDRFNIQKFNEWVAQLKQDIKDLTPPNEELIERAKRLNKEE